jgi:hypothetical protein
MIITAVMKASDVNEVNLYYAFNFIAGVCA